MKSATMVGAYREGSVAGRALRAMVGVSLRSCAGEGSAAPMGSPRRVVPLLTVKVLALCQKPGGTAGRNGVSS